jgi:hypothetical protein
VYKNTYRQFYAITSRSIKNQKYAAILYAKKDDLELVIDEFRGSKRHRTPDPNVFETYISEIDYKLINEYLS